MGFYGNISNSNKSSFTFDRVYSTRVEMDAACDTDGIFLGRFVLVEYDVSPIKGYYKDSIFYTDSEYTVVMSVIDGNYYQDLNAGGNNVYRYNQAANTFVAVSTKDYDYGAHYGVDVATYGRGYDSTAWMKRYDSENNRFKYVMIAELNTVVPDFHLFVDPPSKDAVPYFDKYSTNLNYYLHIPADYSHTFDTIDFNVQGFNKEKRNYIEKPTNEIGYVIVDGTRKYLSNIYDDTAEVAKDTYRWHITLQGIGNMVCQFWDLLYGTERQDDISMALNDAASRDPETVIGALNLIRDLLGYAIKPVSETPKTDADYNIIYYEDNGNSRKYYYYVKDVNGNYTLQLLPNGGTYENSIYGLLTYLYTLLGVGDPTAINTTTVHGCINKMNLLFSMEDGNLNANSFVVTDANGKFTTLGGPNDTIQEQNSELLLLKAGIWTNLEDITVTDPFSEELLQKPLNEVLADISNRVSQGAGRYKGLDILDDLNNVEKDYAWNLNNGEIKLDISTESDFATLRGVDYSIYLAEQKMNVLYDMLLNDLVHHFKLEMKDFVFAQPLQFNEDHSACVFILDPSAMDTYCDENGIIECSYIITGTNSAGVSQTIEQQLTSAMCHLQLEEYGFTSFEKIVLRRTHPLRSKSIELTPIIKELVLYDKEAE